MNEATLQQALARAMGLQASKTGACYGVYRPHGHAYPLSPAGKLFDLQASFRAPGNGAPQAPGYGQPLWTGIFDNTYTRPGDYLRNEEAIYFIATQIPGLPMQCIRTNNIVTAVRPVAAAPSGYSGLYASQGEAIMLAWPASILQAGSHAGGIAPNETRLGSWILLLPPHAPSLQATDIVTADDSNTYVVGSAEHSNLGWRITLRQISA